MMECGKILALLGAASAASFLWLARPAHAEPSADQVLADLGWSAEAKRRVLNGEFVTIDLPGVSDEDLAIAIAFLVETSPDDLGKQIMTADLVTKSDSQVRVFPEPLCGNLPGVGPEVKTWVAQVAPELAQVPVRELPEKTALDVFGRAAASGWGSVDVLTHGVFREPCTFYLSREALRAVDAAFDLDLLTVIRGQDRKGQNFEMAAILAGRGKLVVVYDRDGIVYRNERLDRDFKLSARVEFDTPAAGELKNVHGLCAKVLLLGCVRIRSIVKVGETLEVRAGTFTSETTVTPIQARGGGAGHSPAPRAGAGPRPAASGISG